MTIRAATEADAGAIARIVNAAFEVERPVRGPVGDRTSIENVRELMRGGDRFFVAEQEGRLIASVFVRVRESGADRAEKVGYFGMLAVDPSLQGGGVGRALREYAEALAKDEGCAAMTLTTGEFRSELVPYYERAGYRVTKIEDGPKEWGLAHPFRVVHMTKTL
jgi:predicted N-acetyltransferase YhbS